MEVGYAAIPLVPGEAVALLLGNGIVGPLVNHLQPAASILHVGLVFKLMDYTELELHYGTSRRRNGVIEVRGNYEPMNRSYYCLGELDVVDAMYDRYKAEIFANWQNRPYHLGRSDCWKMVEWFAASYLGIAPGSLPGPMGRRNSLGNAARHHISKVNSDCPIS